MKEQKSILSINESQIQKLNLQVRNFMKYISHILLYFIQIVFYFNFYLEHYFVLHILYNFLQ